MRAASDTFLEGDIVIWTEGGTWNRHDVWGYVTRVTPKGTVFTVEKRKDPEAKEKQFLRERGLRKPSAHELAHRMWWVKPPKAEIAFARRGLGRREVVEGLGVDQIDTPAKARQAAKELLALAAWWEEEPKS